MGRALQTLWVRMGPAGIGQAAPRVPPVSFRSWIGRDIAAPCGVLHGSLPLPGVAHHGRGLLAK